ncbi:hypothetical protein AB0F59_09285 [Micromonospora lupini]|uniref:hypothetical protein n=1 Tax=Micromonospora lupini TaxID=285679 RepID=UPI0033EA920C
MTEIDEYPVRRVPLDQSGRLELQALRPPLWEYLLFGNALHLARAEHEARWRDFQLGYSLKIGPVIEPKQLPDVLRERLSHVSAIVSNLESILSRTAQERAFGKPGESGDPILIEHMARRLIDLYALLLGWSEETRALRLPDWADRLKEILTAYAAQPIERTYYFVDEFIENIEMVITKLAEGQPGPHNVEIHVTYEIGDDLSRQFDQELDRVRRYIN